MITDWVRWSTQLDKEGRRMIMVGGAHFPQDLADKIAQDIVELLKKGEPK